MDQIEFMSSMKDMETQIMEEVTDAQKYMLCADHWKSEPSIANTYMTIAKQEIEHAKNINEMMSSLKNLSDDQKVIVKFLIDMNNDQIRRVSNK